jgi:hypothetical protein
LESGRDVSTEQTRNVRTSLKRTHLPLLKDAAIIDVIDEIITPAANYPAALATLSQGLVVESLIHSTRN